MRYDKNEIYILNPDYVMRNDSHRVVLFSRDKTSQLSTSHWESFLHPLHAQIFSFFTFNRPLNITVSLLEQYLKRDEQTVRNIVYPFIENQQSFYTKYRDEKVRIPKNVIISRNKISEEVVFLNINPDVFSCRNIDLTTERNYLAPQMLTFMLNNSCVSNCIYWMPQFIIGDVSKQSISEVWNSSDAHKLMNLNRADIQESSPCKNCNLFKPCFDARNRCWVDIVKAYGKENWDYPDPRCAFAPAMINDLGFN